MGPGDINGPVLSDGVSRCTSPALGARMSRWMGADGLETVQRPTTLHARAINVTGLLASDSATTWCIREGPTVCHDGGAPMADQDNSRVAIADSVSSISTRTSRYDALACMQIASL